MVSKEIREGRLSGEKALSFGSWSPFSILPSCASLLPFSASEISASELLVGELWWVIFGILEGFLSIGFLGGSSRGGGGAAFSSSLPRETLCSASSVFFAIGSELKGSVFMQSSPQSFSPLDTTSPTIVISFVVLSTTSVSLIPPRP